MMGTVAKMAERVVAVMAEHTEPFGIPLGLEPAVQSRSGAMGGIPAHAAVAVDVVDAQELRASFATTHAGRVIMSIMHERRHAQALMAPLVLKLLDARIVTAILCKRCSLAGLACVLEAVKSRAAMVVKVLVGQREGGAAKRAGARRPGCGVHTIFYY
jgi:hypothetical protein